MSSSFAHSLCLRTRAMQYGPYMYGDTCLLFLRVPAPKMGWKRRYQTVLVKGFRTVDRLKDGLIKIPCRVAGNFCNNAQI